MQRNGIATFEAFLSPQNSKAGISISEAFGKSGALRTLGPSAKVADFYRGIGKEWIAKAIEQYSVQKVAEHKERVAGKPASVAKPKSHHKPKEVKTTLQPLPVEERNEKLLQLSSRN